MMLTYMSTLMEGFNTKARSPEKFMVLQHDDQSKEDPHEGTSLNQSRGQRVCVSAFHPGGTELHLVADGIR